MADLSAVIFNGYRLDTNGRKFDAVAIDNTDIVPEGMYTLVPDPAAADPLRRNVCAGREYFLQPQFQKNITAKYHLVISRITKALGIRADTVPSNVELDNKPLTVRYSAPWIQTARAQLGQREAAGAKANPRILEYYKASGFWGTDDTGGDNAWCASFVSWVMSQHGFAVPENAYRAKQWSKFGRVIPDPVYGAIGVKSRKGGGHVAFVLGRSANGKQLYMLGGNQGDAVSIAAYARTDWSTFVLPATSAVTEETLPIFKGASQAAGSEA